MFPFSPRSAGAGTRCNTIRGATEGILFPRNIRKDMRFSVYRKAFCRTLPLQFVREGPTKDQVPAYWYTLGDDIFETPDVNPDNSCYCRPEVAPCLPRGLSDLTPCYYGKPVRTSWQAMSSRPKVLCAPGGQSRIIASLHLCTGIPFGNATGTYVSYTLVDPSARPRRRWSASGPSVPRRRCRCTVFGRHQRKTLRERETAKSPRQCARIYALHFIWLEI